jgi:hypothetical protein
MGNMVLYKSLFINGFSIFFDERYKKMVIRLTHFSLIAVVAVSFLAQSGCMRGPSRVYAPKIDAEAAGPEAIKMYDTNKDSKISGAELDKVPAFAQAQTLANFKSTKEKGVTAADITARIKAWQATNVGRIGGVNVLVTRAGKPVADVDVKFIPEKFLGESMQSQVCTGKTGQDGYAAISAPVSGPEDVPGVPPGYFRVELTKSDGSIPAKYNTQTIFGDEVAPDVRRITGYTYDMK